MRPLTSMQCTMSFHWDAKMGTGSVAIAADPIRRQAALEEFRRDAYAEKSLGPRAARGALWANILETAGLDPMDLTVDAFETGLAVLRKAGYRSALGMGDQALVDLRELRDPREPLEARDALRSAP